MAWTEEKEGEGFSKIAGRCTEIRATVAPEPWGCGIDSSHDHPVSSGFPCVERHIDGVSEFMGDIVSNALRIIGRTGVNFDPAVALEDHCPDTLLRRHEHDVVVKLLPGKGDKSERRRIAN